MVSAASATAFGSFSYQAEKPSDNLNQTYSMGFINPGETGVQVKLSGEDSDNYNITFEEESFELSPSSIETDPSGSGYYHIGEGRYVEIFSKEFTIQASEYRESNVIDFPVTVEASTVGQDQGETTQETVYVQEHWFTLAIDPSIIPEDEPRDIPEYRERFWEEADDYEEEFNFEQNETQSYEGQNRSERESLPENSSETSETQKSEQEEYTNTTTYVLLSGIALSAIYLLTVI